MAEAFDDISKPKLREEACYADSSEEDYELFPDAPHEAMMTGYLQVKFPMEGGYVSYPYVVREPMMMAPVDVRVVHGAQSFQVKEIYQMNKLVRLQQGFLGLQSDFPRNVTFEPSITKLMLGSVKLESLSDMLNFRADERVMISSGRSDLEYVKYTSYKTKDLCYVEANMGLDWEPVSAYKKFMSGDEAMNDRPKYVLAYFPRPRERILSMRHKPSLMMLEVETGMGMFCLGDTVIEMFDSEGPTSRCTALHLSPFLRDHPEEKFYDDINRSIYPHEVGETCNTERFLEILVDHLKKNKSSYADRVRSVKNALDRGSCQIVPTVAGTPEDEEDALDVINWESEFKKLTMSVTPVGGKHDWATYTGGALGVSAESMERVKITTEGEIYLPSVHLGTVNVPDWYKDKKWL